MNGIAAFFVKAGLLNEEDIGGAQVGERVEVCSRCRAIRPLNDEGVCADCAATLARGYEISSKAGRCRTGSDQTGEVFHARLLDENGYPQWRAVCGTEPGRRSVGWSSWKPADREVTCKRCLRRLADLRRTPMTG